MTAVTDIGRCKRVVASEMWGKLRQKYGAPPGYTARLPWWVMRLWEREIPGDWVASRIVGLPEHLIRIARQAGFEPPCCSRHNGKRRHTHFYVPRELVAWAIEQGLKVNPDPEPMHYIYRRFLR